MGVLVNKTGILMAGVDIYLYIYQRDDSRNTILNGYVCPPVELTQVMGGGAGRVSSGKDQSEN